MLKKILFGTGHNLQRRIYLTNLCSSFLYSIQSAILLLIITRIAGLYEAGVFSIAYTTTQTLCSLGSFSIRNYQVSDVKNHYTFANYFSTRIITIGLMILSCLVCGIFMRLPINQFVILLLFALYRLIDCIEDVFHGEVQKRGRLDVVSVAMLLRISLSLFCFILTFLFTKDLILSSLILVLVSAVVWGILNKTIFLYYNDVELSFSIKRVFPLLKSCFPIFSGTILCNYLINAPKYSINRILNEEMQAIFNIIFMPIFVINILSSFVFKPHITSMGTWWNSGKTQQLTKSIFKQLFFIMGLTLSIAVIGYSVGCSILGAIYGVELTEYKYIFSLLLLFGGISSAATFLTVVLTVMRKQIWVIIGYIVAFGVNWFVMDSFVSCHKLLGASYGYGTVMTVSFMFFLICTILELLKKRVKLGGTNAILK